MHLKDLKTKKPAELVTMAEELGIEGASTLRKQDLLFAILKVQAENGDQIMGLGTIEVLQDGFGFLRSPEANYLAGPDDIYISPNQVRKYGLRTGDTVEGEIRGPKDGERYFALTRLISINFDDPDVVRHRVNFDNLTPLYPEREADARYARPDGQGQVGARHRYRFTAGHGPARADRRAAARRQDGAAAEHRQGDHRQPSRDLPDRAADRRAARGSDRHAALGEGRGDLVHFRRAGAAPRPGRRDGDRKGQAAGRAQEGRRDSARFDHAPGPCLQHRRAEHPARC